MAGLPQTQQNQTNIVTNSTIYTINELEKIAGYIVNSGLFGLKTKDQAISLLLLAQAENLHPMKAVMKYHILQGRPTKKSEAVLADFLRAGGKVKWHELSENKAKATFIAPNGDQVTIEWTIEMAKKAGLLEKDNWKKYPRQMLRARIVSEGVRTVFPEVVEGIYTPEEIIDMDEDWNNLEVKAEIVEEEKEKENSEEEYQNKKITEIGKIIQEENPELYKKIKENLKNKKLSTKKVEEIFNEVKGNLEEFEKQILPEIE